MDGTAPCETVSPHHLSNEERLLSALTPGERQVLADLLRKLLIDFEGAALEEPNRLGVSLHPAHHSRAMRRAVGLPDRVGLLVYGVDHGPAAEAGLIEGGDLLVEADGEELRSIATLHQAIAKAAPANTLQLKIVRGTEKRTLRIDIMS